MISGDVIIGILKGLAEGSKVLVGTDKPLKESTSAISAKPSNTLSQSELDAARRLRRDNARS